MGPPRLLIMYALYKRYEKRYYEKNGEFCEKQPLSFGLWLLRFFGIVFLIAIILAFVGWLIRYLIAM